MKRKQVFNKTLKNTNNLIIVVLFLFTIIPNIQYHSIASTIKNYFLAASATMEVTPTTICLGDFVDIIFEGADGNGKYTFNYTIDGESKTTGEINGNSTTIQYTPISNGNFDIVLDSVAGSDGIFQDISNQSETITVSKPEVDFTFNNNNSCSGTAVLFTPTVIGDGSISYLWSFGDGITSSIKTPTHTYSFLGCADNNFNVTLTVTDGYGCSNTKTKVIAVKPKPDIDFIDLNAGFDEDFNNCGNNTSNPEYMITVENNSNSSSCISTYDVSWGDGLSEINITFPISHTYLELGSFIMKITAYGINGCNNIKNYLVKNSSNPVGAIEIPGNTVNLCLPVGPINFAIGSWGNNPPDTNYNVDYGDGTTELYTQDQLINSTYYNSIDPIASQNFPIPHTYTESSCPNSDFTVNLSISTSCGESLLTAGPIIILKKPDVSFEVANITCLNTAIQLNNTSIDGFNKNCTTDANFYWDFGDGTTSTDVNPVHIYTSSGIFDITLYGENFCGETDPITKQICVEEKLIPIFNLNTSNGCSPLEIITNNATDTSQSCGNEIYLWEVFYTAENCGTAGNWSFTNGTDQNSEAPEFIFNESGIYTLKLTTTNSCGSASTTKNIEVKKPPTATIEPIADFCGPTTISPVAIIENCTSDLTSLTYNWTFTGGNPTTSNLLNPIDIDYSTPGIYTITLEVTNECSVSNTATESFEIFSVPIITNTDLTQEVCSGEVTNEIIFISNDPATTYSWSASSGGSLTGFIASGVTNSIPSQTIINNSGVTESLTYNVIPILNGCEGLPVNFVINIDPTPTILTQPAGSVVCEEGVATQLSVTYENGVGTPMHQWYSNTIDDTTSGTAITGETSSNYDPPTATAGTIYYYVVITFPSGGCSDVVSATAIVEVVPLLTIDTPPSPEIICNGGTATVLTVSYTGGAGTASYQWYENTTNTNTSGTSISGATGSSYTPPVYTVPGNYYYYVEVGLSGSGCSMETSAVYEVEVMADPVIDTQAISIQEICQGVTPQDLEVVVSGGVGTSYSYQWYENTTNTTTSGTSITGAISSIYMPPTATVGTMYYYVEVTQSASGCSVVSATSEVIVNLAPVVTTQPQSETVCVGATPAPLTVTYSNGVGTPTYQWYANTTNTNTGGTLISGETNATYQPLATTAGTLYYYVEITFPTGGCSNLVSDIATIIVTPGITIDTPRPIEIICEGGSAGAMDVTYTGGAGTASYQWYANTTNTNTGGSAITGATGSSYTPPVYTAIGNYYYYVEVSLSGSGCGVETSEVYEVEALADPVIDTQAISAQEICQGVTPQDLEVLVSGGVGTSYSYQWYANTINTTTGGAAVTGATSSIYTPPTSTVGTMYYYVEVTQSASDCSVLSEASEVIVNGAPTILTQPEGSVVCEGGVATQLSVTYENGVGTPTYQWYSNTIDGTTSGTAITGATSSTYDPPTATAGTIYYYVVITFPSGGCSNLVSNPVSIVINEIPKINSDNITICSGVAFNFDSSNDPSNIVPLGTLYTWSAPVNYPTGSITGSSEELNPQNSISQNLINTTLSPATVSYIITPITGSCTGAYFELIVTVNPAISPNINLNNNSCYRENNASIETNITGGVPFSTGNPYQISWAGPNGFNSTLSSIYNLEPGNYIVTIDDQGGCPFNDTYLISEPEELLITTDSEKNISCYNGNDGEIHVSANGGTLDYTYNWSTTNGLGLVIGAEDQNTLSAGIYNLEVVDNNDCVVSKSYVLSEPSELLINLISKEDILCFGYNTGSIQVEVLGGTPIETSPGVFGYNYEWAGPNGFTSNLKDNANLFAGIYNLTVTDNLGCEKQLPVVLLQPNEILIDVTKTNVKCYGANDGSIDISLSGGLPPYIVSWDNLAIGTSLNNLSEGIYTVTVEDINGCIEKETIEISQPIFYIDPIVTQISCFGANDASINLNITGGVEPIIVKWLDGSTAGIERNNLSAGTYEVIIEDSSIYPCPIKTSFTIVEPLELQLNGIVTDALDCTIVNSGSIDLQLVGGSYPYTYTWNYNNENTQDLSNIPPGNYLVEVEDAHGCSVSKQFEIIRQEPLALNLETSSIPNCETREVVHKIIAHAEGGFPPYSYSWSSGIISGVNNEIMTTSQNGTYNVLVTDGRGCTHEEVFSINTPQIGMPSFTYSSFSIKEYSILSINDPIQFINNSIGEYEKITWDFGDDSILVNEENPSHTYSKEGVFVVTQTITSKTGCAYSFQIKLEITKGYQLIIPNAFSPNEDGINDTIRPFFKGMNKMEMSIYDTWGALIYYEEGLELKGWGGSIKGKPAENGNYVMDVRCVVFYNKVITERSPITLLK